jgi:serine kinase
MNKENISRGNLGEEKKEGCSLLNANYYTADKLGEGTFGAVSTVYDDEGQMFAMKAFDAETDEVSDSDDEGETRTVNYGTCELGTLREISVLRMFSRVLPEDVVVEHPGIMRMHDITFHRDKFCMIMPKASCNLTKAIKGGALSNPQKLQVAYRLLHTLAFLHANKIIHRDIKCDNILLDDDMMPVLADFSLAKLFDENLDGDTHTPGPGTPTYKAPEVYREEGYGLSADVFSLGVCLFEVFNGILSLDRDKAALGFFEGVRAKMSKEKPIPVLLSGMLDPDPATRLTALAALENPAFEKIHNKPLPGKKMPLPPITKVVDKLLSVKREGAKTPKKGKKGKKDGGAKKRGDAGGDTGKLMSLLEFSNPMTQAAAKVYHRTSGAPIEYCMILAGRLYEAELLSMGVVEDYLEDFDLEDYVDYELKIFKAMNYCLFI